MKNVFSDSKHTWQNASVYNLAYSSLLLFPPQYELFKSRNLQEL